MRTFWCPVYSIQSEFTVDIFVWPLWCHWNNLGSKKRLKTYEAMKHKPNDRQSCFVRMVFLIVYWAGNCYWGKLRSTNLSFDIKNKQSRELLKMRMYGEANIELLLGKYCAWTKISWKLTQSFKSYKMGQLLNSQIAYTNSKRVPIAR